MGTFDPATFLDGQQDGGFSTEYTPCPEGEFNAVVDAKPEVRQWTSQKDPSKSGLAMDITWSVDDAGVKAQLDKEKVIVRQGIMFDLNPQGGIDRGKGKNVKLGRLLEAVGLNNKQWNADSFVGQMARITVKHRVYEGEIFAEVKDVAPLR